MVPVLFISLRVLVKTTLMFVAHMMKTSLLPALLMKLVNLQQKFLTMKESKFLKLMNQLCNG